jgi:hypothetical protein
VVVTANSAVSIGRWSNLAIIASSFLWARCCQGELWIASARGAS